MDDIIVLLRIYKTTIQMLNDRKYDMKNYLDHLSYSRDDFISNFGKTDEINIDLNKLEMNFNKLENEQDKINVYWFDDEKLDNTIATDYIKKLEKNKINKGIVIVKHKNAVTPIAKKILQEPTSLDSGKYKIVIETFIYHELIINITEHYLVPKHTLLNKEERDELLKKYKETQLPKIQIVDPMAKYLGLQKGDIVKIEKENKFGARYVSYRYIV